MNLTRRIIAILSVVIYNSAGFYLLITEPTMREGVFAALGLANGLVLGFYFGASKNNGVQ